MPCILAQCKNYMEKTAATIFWVEYSYRNITMQKYVIGLQYELSVTDFKCHKILHENSVVSLASADVKKVTIKLSQWWKASADVTQPTLGGV